MEHQKAYVGGPKVLFYPDFVGQLKDGRILVVEYKVGFLWTDAEEKRAIGAVWASRCGGKCLFGMPSGGDFTAIIATLRTTTTT